MNYKQPIFIAVGIITAAIVIALFVAYTKRVENPTIQNETQNEVLEEKMITFAPEMISLAENSYLLDIQGSYPQFTQSGPEFNKTIKDFVVTGIESFKQESNDNHKARIENGWEDFEKEFTQKGLYSYQVKTEIIQSNSSFISIAITVSGYTGGAHGYSNTVTFNYDVTNKKEIGLDYFYPNNPNYLKTISDISRVQLTEKLIKASEQDVLDDNIKSMMIEGTDPSNPQNFKMFTFTNNEIHVYFGQYQVAPYVYGEQTIILPRNQ